ncbi:MULTISPECIES: DNA-3-methyladenine glycosylase family protein [Streptomycetaceae]|uniref:DNA-3-methyladenine glycosylase II n=1 Tax=Streptantibioticus cattleyicolor (strain ATCC 35852 / DSM 46488 / JCM 4925 / NBRC 14057 / NRRL 8057) TaxID=1003195 RepID=F8K3E5_STREN
MNDDEPQAEAVEDGPDGFRLRLAHRPPLDLPRLFRFLAARAVPGVEEYGSGTYRRVLTLPHGPGTVALTDGGEGYVTGRLRLADRRDLPVAVALCRRLLDLDTDPAAVTEALAGCPLLGPLRAAAPGLRSPGHVSPAELAVRALLGQQISVAGARTIAGRLTAAYGRPLPVADGGLTHEFPTAEALGTADPADLPMPTARKTALYALAGALASGEVVLDPDADPDEAESRLRALPGIGPWTASYIRMRALGDPDVFLATDLGVRHALERLGHPGDPANARRLAERWRPWRSYASHHLWSTLEPS